MHFDRLRGLGLEAIDFQSGAFFEALKEEIGNIRKGKVTEDTVKASRLSDIVKSYTNMSVVTHLDPDYNYNAYVIPPQVDKNHPFFREYFRPHLTSKGVAAIKKAGTALIASVNRETSKVSGHYTEYDVDIYFTMGLLTSSATDGEIAAIFLHELGHLFTYYEFLGQTFTANLVLQCTVNEIMGTDDLKERQVLLQSAEKALNVKIPDEGSVLKVPNEKLNDTIPVVFLSAMAQKSLSATGTNIYDIRAWEQLSDQFATRHGAGRDLVTALDKIYRQGGVPSRMGTAEFLTFEALKFTTLWGVFILAPIAVGAFALAIPGLAYLMSVLFLSNPQEKVYDDPGKRLGMVRLQLTEALKAPKLNPKRRKALLDDIAYIENIEENYNDRKGLLEFLWAKVFPWGRKSASQADVMGYLETLSNNQLFVSAAKFTQGVDHV